MRNKLFACIVLLAATLTQAQSQFQARATNGSIATHTVCQGTGCVIDNRISNSSTTGFTSPQAVIFEHVGGKSFNVGFGVLEFGSFEFGTGSFISGNLASSAVFGVDSSYVKISSNGSCGQFQANGSCMPGGFTPQTDTLFVGAFLGTIAWSTNPDKSHTITGRVRGFVNGGTTAVVRNFVATTVPDPNPFVSNGWLTVETVSVAP